MKKLFVALCTLFVLQVQSVFADFYVIPVGANVGTVITSLPYTISKSGFYYLKKDLSLTTANTGITVNADDVTIDLMGHTIVGAGGTVDDGVYMHARSNVEIRNGTIKNFGRQGILEDSTSSGHNHRVLNVRSINNFNGIYLHGTGHLIKGCTLANNSADGISSFDGASMIIGNISRNNGYDGIYCSSQCLIQSNLAYGNSQTSAGFKDIACGTCTKIENHAPVQ